MYKAKLASIGGILKTACCSSGDIDFESVEAAFNPPSIHTEKVAADVELVFRSVIDELLLDETSAIAVGCPVYRLLSISVSIGLKNINFSKIPFLLIEDLLEGQTLARAERFWYIVESFTDQLTLPELFNRGKLVILRTCNSLLRKLSKSCNTEFCGRVLMFLAAVYPLTERSAVNLSGKINVSGIPLCDNEEQFLSKRQKHSSDDSSEKATKDKADTNAKDKDLTYDTYSSFWKLQTYLCGESKEVTHYLDERGELSSEFDGLLVKFLCLFEKNTFSSAEMAQDTQQTVKSHHKAIEHLQSRTDMSTNDAENESRDVKGGDAGLKYLTSSQLFELELRDPLLRQQMSAQIIIYLHNLKHRPVPPPPTVPASKMINITSRTKQAQIAAQAASAAAQVETTLHKTHEIIDKYTARAYHIIKKSPHGGIQFVKMLRSLLDRENYWCEWKKTMCPAFERYQPLVFKARAEEESTYSDKGLLAKLNTNTDGTNVCKYSTFIQGANDKKRKLDKNCQLANYYCGHSDAEVKNMAKALVEKVPTFEAIIEAYVDAEDPDAGIDDEYHPKHDSLYCWRARRLMADFKLRLFEEMQDGDIGKGLAKLNELSAVKPLVTTGSTSILASLSTEEPSKDKDNKNAKDNGVKEGGAENGVKEGGGDVSAASSVQATPSKSNEDTSALDTSVDSTVKDTAVSIVLKPSTLSSTLLSTVQNSTSPNAMDVTSEDTGNSGNVVEVGTEGGEVNTGTNSDTVDIESPDA